MPTVTDTVLRGDYKFSILISSATPGPAPGTPTTEVAPSPPDVQVAVWHEGRRIDAGSLEPFPPAYLASLRYRLAYRGSASKPVGRVGTVLIGPDAWNALQAAIAAARQRLGAQIRTAGGDARVAPE